MGKSHSLGLLDDPDDEEYEYMNKQTPVLQRQNSHWMKPNKTRTSSVSSQVTACSGDTTLPLEVRGVHTKSKDNSESEHQGSNEVQYEYMDIRGGDREEIPPAHEPPPPPPIPAKLVGQVEDEDEEEEEEEGEEQEGEEQKEEEEEEEEDEYLEDSNYHYTNRQPKLRQALHERKELQERENGEAYEYEDMDCFAALQPGDAVVYQNLQREGDGAAGRHRGESIWV